MVQGAGPPAILKQRVDIDVAVDVNIDFDVDAVGVV